MRGVLIPVDDATGGTAVLRAAISRLRDGSIDAIHLLNVQAPLTAYSTQFINGRVVRDFLRERGERALSDARRRLDGADIAYTAHIRVGDPASTIGEVARELRVGEILVGLDDPGWLRGLMHWLAVNRLRRYATVPVVLVMAPPTVLRPIIGSVGSAPLR